MASQAIMNTLANFLPSDGTLQNAEAPTEATPPVGSNITQAASDSPWSSISAGSLSFSVIPSLLISLAIRHQDVLKLVVIGGIIETCRRLVDMVWRWCLDAWFITAYFESTDDTFEWMMVWLAKQAVWAKAREVHISTASWGQTHHKGVEIPEGGDGSGLGEETGFQTKRKLAYLPTYGARHWLRYKGTWMSVERAQKDSRDAWARGKEESLEISLFTRDHRILRSLLQDAKKAYKTEDEDTVEIWGADSYNQWYRMSTRKKRPLQSIILEPEIKDMILDDAKDFLSTEKWYTDRGIPYRRGYLLHGVPGSGKTSLIHSIAGELGLDIYVVSLAKKGLDDSSLNELICDLPSRSIALMEDIDAAFGSVGTAREGVAGTGNDEGPGLGGGSGPGSVPSPGAASPGPAGKETESKGVTLSGLLGALDGVAAQEGRILFATTNRYKALDEALCRAGRMDVHVEFGKATRWQARELFRRFFPPDGGYEGDTGGRIEASKDGDGKEKVVEKTSQQGSVRTDWLTQEESAALAEAFADAIPEGKFSMASLQGHLMRYKQHPREAVEKVAEWMEQESRKRGVGARDVEEKEVKERKEVKEVKEEVKEVKEVPS